MGNSGKMLVIWSIWPPSANSNPKSKIPRFIPVWGQFKICSGKQVSDSSIKWAASSEFGTYRLCEQWRFRRACASALSRQNLRCYSYKQWVKRSPQTESQIPSPSEWLGMHSYNLSRQNARRHKFAWSGSNYKIEKALSELAFWTGKLTCDVTVHKWRVPVMLMLCWCLWPFDTFQVIFGMVS